MAATSNQVKVTDTGGQLIAAGTVACVIRNSDGANEVFVGPSGVTSGTGFGIAPGEVISFATSGDAIHAVCGTGATALVHWIAS